MVETSVWPSRSWTVRMSMPLSRRCEANECRRVWQVMRLARSALVTAAWNWQLYHTARGARPSRNICTASRISSMPASFSIARRVRAPSQRSIRAEDEEQEQAGGKHGRREHGCGRTP